MAVRTWIGTDATTPNDWSVAGNWSEDSVPVNGDDVYFVSGDEDVTAGFQQGAVTLDSIHFGTKWTGSIATELEIDATVIDYANKIGTVTMEGTFTTVNVAATSSSDTALGFPNSTINKLIVTGGRGTISLSSGTVVSNAIDVIGASNVTISIDSGCDVSAVDVTIDDGKFQTYEEVDTVTQFGGLTEFLNSAGTTASITMYDGTCKYKVTGATTLTTLLMYGGFFDMRGSIAPTHTITDATLYSGSMIDERNGLENTTYTNPITMNGGIVKCDNGRSVTVS